MRRSPIPSWEVPCLTKKSETKTVLRILSYMKPHARALAAAGLLTVASSALALAIPSYAGKAIDYIGTDGSVQFGAVWSTCGKMLLCVALNALSSYLTQVIFVRVTSQVTAQMRQEVFDHLLSLPVGYFDRTQTGDLVSRISYDIDTINTSLSSDFITLATSAITVAGSAVMMVRISPFMCLAFLFSIPMTLWITWHRAKVVRPLFSLRSRKLGELNGFSEEMLSGQRTIKAYGREEAILQRFDQKNQEAVDSYYQADYQGSIVGPTVTFINNLTLAIIAGLGGISYMSGSVTLGRISSFILYSRRFSGPISNLAEISAELQSAISAARRVFATLDEPSEPADAPDALVLQDVKGSVRFNEVRFSYAKGEEILHGLSLEAPEGKMVAIVGPTGAGKTTIINLLMRFYDPDSGVITIDGFDIRRCTRESLRRQFSMVLQDTWLFEGTIYENVAFGCDQATKEDVVRVCKAVDIHEFILSLKDGYDTVLTDEGVNISKGQKQLLTIARAMLQKPRMLILDEATSAVDSRTEQKIQSALTSLCRGKTTFIIAHRLSTIKEADWIIVLDHGSIREQGTHRDLLQKKGFYASLFNAQWDE